MNVSFDYERLVPLLSSFYVLTGIRADLYDHEFKPICVKEEQAVPFCARINSCPEGHARCLQCDREAMSRAKSGKPYFYRCHAGICEAILSIKEGAAPLAFLFCGQYLDDSDPEQQWERTKESLSWFSGDFELLRQDYMKMSRYGPEQVDAYARILAVLGRYIQLEGMIQSAEQTDGQRLERYLREHYREKLSLEKISGDLNIGRTRLCVLAREISGGATLSRLITDRRIEEAKRILRQGDTPVAAVAEAVGISDYNYFTKVFRKATGMTPTDYRRNRRRISSRTGEPAE